MRETLDLEELGSRHGLKRKYEIVMCALVQWEGLLSDLPSCTLNNVLPPPSLKTFP